MIGTDNAQKTFYITSPIYYVSGQPHIGTAYTTIACDVLARYQRLRGREVVFATGTDEHGQKVVRGAANAGMSPQDFVDGLVADYKRAWERLHVEYSRFIRTTEPEHTQLVQRVFARLVASDDIYKAEYTGWYCIPCETYLLEQDLDDGNCPECGRPTEQVSQEAYFFRTSKYADALLRHIEEHEEFIGPESRRNEVAAFIKSGLRDSCVSRTRSDWDIPVPGDEGQSIYVWFDALLNYLTVAGYGGDDGRFDRLWPADVQLMGKDILPRFHATIWPAMLMALGLPLPTTLFGHGWWSDADGQKMSKSKGNFIDPFETIQRLVEYSGTRTAFAVDALRYYVLREVPFGLDGSFSMRGLLSRFNADLANDLGNLLNRSLPLLQRYVDGVVPEAGPASGALAEDITRTAAGMETNLDRLNYRDALIALWQLIARCNKFVDEREPWLLHKQGKRVELDAVLYDVVDCIRAVAILVSPFMPEVGEEVWDQLGLKHAGTQMSWDDARAGALAPGTHINRGVPIFPRIDIDGVLAEEPQAVEEQQADTGKTNMISFKQFQEVELVTGKVIEAERVPDADKLLVLRVDVGEAQPRQIVAGLAEHFNPRQLLGRTVIVVANLEPANIRGIESNGMVLAAGEKEPLALITTDAEVEPGHKVR